MKNSFFKDLPISYYNTIQNMDLRIVYPFTEFEIQPLYSDLWIKNLEILFDSVTDYENIRKYILNPSVIRSMLIMDLFDIEFTKKYDLLEKLFGFYEKCLKNLYFDDCFSLKNNKPILNIDLKIYPYYRNSDFLIQKLMGICFSLSYLINQDIYADNCYEIKGLYHIKDYYLIVYDFNIQDLKIRIVQYDCDFNNKGIKGSIDLFGHSTYFLIKNYCVEIDENFIKDEEILGYIKKLESIYSTIISIKKSELVLKNENFVLRYKRYEKLFDRVNIIIDEEIFYRLKNNKKNRLLDSKLLYLIIDTLVKKGN